MGDKGAFVRRLAFEDIQHLLPEPQPWDGTSAGVDLFICALGFEDRACSSSVELARALPKEAVAMSLLAIYDTNAVDNECNGEKVRAALASFSRSVKTFCADDPQEVRSALSEALTELGREKRSLRVALDISGASATLVLSVWATLTQHAHMVSLRVLYTEALEHYPSRHEYDTALDILIKQGLADGDDASFAEQGVYEVDTNELYPGHSVESRPDHIIAIPSLRTSRLVGCLARIGDQPLASPGESLYWILSEPPGELQWRLDLQRRIVNRQLANLSGREPTAPDTPTLNPNNSTVCSTRDYRAILETLVTRIDTLGGKNITLVHMGSQLQSVGVALALNIREEVTVLRSRPKQFNVSKYTKGIGPMWKIDFNDLSAVLDALRRVGTLQLQTKLEDAREARPLL